MAQGVRVRSALSFKTLLLIVFIGVFFFIAANHNLAGRKGEHYTYLADAFLTGRLDFTAMPGSWIDSVYQDGKYYWPLGPFPAVVLMPFHVVGNAFGVQVFQGDIQIIITTGVFILAYVLAKKFRYSGPDALLLAFGFCFASVYGLVAMVSVSYYFAHAVGVFLLFWALYEYYNRRRFILIGSLCALMLATRPTQAMTVGMFALLLITTKDIAIKAKLVKLIQLVVPLVAVGSVLLWYNAVRFGDPLDNGYTRSSATVQTSQERYEQLTFGLFKMGNIPTNFYYYFLHPPQPVRAAVQSGFGQTYYLTAPFISVRYPGVGVFYVSIVFLYIFKTLAQVRTSREVGILWGSVVGITLVLLSYYWVGWTQVGPRYLLDVWPVCYILLLYAFTNRVLSPGAKIAICLGAVINLFLLLFLSV